MQTRLYTIRPARQEELPKIQRIEQAAAQLFRDSPYPEIAFEEDGGGMSLESLEHWLTHGKVWVAVDVRDEPVGFAVARAVDGAAYLHELDVHPHHGRQGLGERLIDTVAQWARENDYPAVTLSTFANVTWNEPYYTRLGFRRLQEEALGPGLQEVRAHEAEAGLDMAQRVCMIRLVR